MSFHIPAHKNVSHPAGQFIPAAVEPEAPKAKDFQYVNHGSIVLLFARTESARNWCDEFLPEDCARHGSGYAIEPRYFDVIWADILDADFVV